MTMMMVLMVMMMVLMVVVFSGRSLWSTQEFPVRINFNSSLEKLVGYMG